MISKHYKLIIKIKADEEIRTLDPLLGKEMLYHGATSATRKVVPCAPRACNTEVPLVKPPQAGSAKIDWY